MKFTKQVAITVNGKTIQATVTVDAPGLDVVEDCVNAQMILFAAATGQNTQFRSRHHKDRAATIQVNTPPESPLRLVA